MCLDLPFSGSSTEQLDHSETKTFECSISYHHNCPGFKLWHVRGHLYFRCICSEVKVSVSLSLSLSTVLLVRLPLALPSLCLHLHLSLSAFLHLPISLQLQLSL